MKYSNKILLRHYIYSLIRAYLLVVLFNITGAKDIRKPITLYFKLNDVTENNVEEVYDYLYDGSIRNIEYYFDSNSGIRYLWRRVPYKAKEQKSIKEDDNDIDLFPED